MIGEGANIIMNVEKMENYLKKIRSVQGCKVVIDENDCIDEIHIVSDLRRNPKQILRDIEAILISEFDISIDYKKVSIAQIKGDTVRQDSDPRLKIKSIEYNNNGTNVEVRVVLERCGQVFESSMSGINTSSNINRILGNTVLKAVEKFLEIDDVFVFEDARRVNLSNVEVMVVSISSQLKGREEIYTGSAKIGNDSKEALARATMDSINRHILQLIY
ncbi:hypothetical protein SH1V18_31020 [Vallitalea longa]|uniref:Uncharacterized protein n=2 Tax=Vallitalea longa TaxID=2936439 RepID=A0A9W5YAY4_9FIRM|nr:hypothetical protein SH1V18_31020 [Vallitalea longa]